MATKRSIILVALAFCCLYAIFILSGTKKLTNLRPQQTYQPVADTFDHSQGTSPGPMLAEKAKGTKKSRYPSISPTPKSYKTAARYQRSNRVAVVLVGEGRSGFDWLSAFFWRNPNVFYVHEPLDKIVENDEALSESGWSLKEGQIQQLADVFSCKLNYSAGETVFPSALGRYPYYQPEFKDCEAASSCPSLTPLCQSRSHTIQKVLRMKDLADYQMLQRKLDIPLKIIHLIRDPRPTILSRETSFPHMLSERSTGPVYLELSEEERSEERRAFCGRILKNLHVGDSGLFNRNEYLRVSHEDMTQDPVSWARRLYKFVGLEFTTSSEAHIRSMGHSDDELSRDPDVHVAASSPYRDTANVLYRWMSASRAKVHRIETECSEVLEYLGYERVYNDELHKVRQNPWPKIVQDGL